MLSPHVAMAHWFKPRTKLKVQISIPNQKVLNVPREITCINANTTSHFMLDSIRFFY